MKHGLRMFTVHAAITYTTADGWEGSRAGVIPTFAVIGGTTTDAEVNAAALFGMPVGTVYTVPGQEARTITGATFTAYPMDDDEPAGPPPGRWYRFQMSMDGGRTWATYASGMTDVDVTTHLSRIRTVETAAGVEVRSESYTSGVVSAWQHGLPVDRTVRWEWTPEQD